MGDTITQEQLQELRRDVEETKWLTFTVLQMWIGKEKAGQALIDADLYTLEEIAAKPRAEVVAVKGVGRVTMRHLESAMAERGLTFAEAS